MNPLCEREEGQETKLFPSSKIEDLKSRVFLFPIYLFVSWQYNSSVAYSSSLQVLAAVGVSVKAHPS